MSHGRRLHSPVWRGNYKGELREMDVYSMMRTAPSEVVKPIHTSGMPVIPDSDDYGTWLTGSPDEAADLLKPFPGTTTLIALE